ncbi:MAG: hypothetical protein EXR62_17515 [Chloroflexi bacterium]|nr:hypothetical protein [Chloroflexota bacterium]
MSDDLVMTGAFMRQQQTLKQDMQKRKFLQITKVCNEQQAISNSLIAALQRNRTYASNVGWRARAAFRDRLAELLRGISRQYGSQVDDNSHVKNILDISHVLSEEFALILYEGRFRIGTSQKALNLYLKFLWCLDLNGIPQHVVQFWGPIIVTTGSAPVGSGLSVLLSTCTKITRSIDTRFTTGYNPPCVQNQFYKGVYHAICHVLGVE